MRIRLLNHLRRPTNLQMGGGHKPFKLRLLLLGLYFALLPLANDVLAVQTANAATTGGGFIVATYNIRHTEVTPWGKDNRGDKILNYLKTVDVVGLQEVSNDSRAALKKGLSTAGYTKSKFDDAVDIFWKSSKFSVVSQGIKDVTCNSAKGTTQKDMVWVKLTETASGQSFYFLTTHLDVGSSSCRLKQISNVVGVVRSTLSDAPAIFVGDMNSKGGSNEDKAIQAAGFGDAYNVATTKTNTDQASTFSGGVGGTPHSGSPIDHIYVKNGVSVSSVDVKNQAGSDHRPVEAAVSLSGGSTTVPITIGAYNALGCNHTPGGSRMSTIAKNINSLEYDVVGMSEYNEGCVGDIIKSLKQYGDWKDTKYYGDWQKDQSGIIYNADKVTLESEELFNSAPASCSAIQHSYGGTCYVRIGHFVSNTGVQFVVANGHYAQDHSKTVSDVRVKQVKSVINKLQSESIPAFIVGDTNASPPYATGGDAKDWYKSYDHEFYDAIKEAGYQMASRTALEKKNEKMGTLVAASDSAAYQIDQVFYKGISAPSYFEVFGCGSISSCGSDHRPVKAVFGAGDPCDPSAAGDTSTTNGYKAHNNINYTGTNSVCCATASPTGDTGGPLTGSSNAEKAFNFLTTTSFASNGGKPLNAVQAAGIVGNLMIESGGDTYDLRPDAVNSIGAAGIVQWYKGRRTALNSFAASKGKDWTDLKTQLQFIVYELDGSYYKQTVMVGSKAGGKDINKGLANITDSSESSVRVAADIVGRWYETPSISDHYPNRQNAAIRAFNDFGGGGGATGTATSATSAGSCSQEKPGDFATTVESYVWADGRRGSAQKDAYKAAVKESKYGNDANHNYGNDCAAFVYILMTTSGYDPNYKGAPTRTMVTWLPDSKSGWGLLYDVGKVDVGGLQPGDVAIRDGHTFVWVGDNLKDEKGNAFAGKSAEAANESNTAPTTILKSNTFSDPSGYTWYRKKAS